MEIAGGTGLSQNTDAIVGNNSDAVGYVTLSGVGSNWLFALDTNDLTVGASGVGVVSLDDFARVTVPGDTEVGLNSTGVGSINIEGTGTLWKADTAIIGMSGLGNLKVTDGGRFLSDSSTLGSNQSGEGRAVIADALSQWSVAGGVTVGSSGRGTITLLSGGLLRTTTSSTIANAVSGTGLVEIIGAGSLWNSADGNVTVGSTGVGKLNIFEAGRLSLNGGSLQLASTTSSRGEVWVDGINSLLTTNSSITSGSGESLLTISNGGEVSAASMIWGGGARLTLQGGRLKMPGQGGLSSSGLIAGSGVIEAGSVNNVQAGPTRGRVQVAAGEHLRLTGSVVNHGLIDINGGELELAGGLTNHFDIDARHGGILRVGSTGLANSNGAQLAITAGEIDVYGQVTNKTGAQILVGNGASAVFHDTITNNGELAVLSGSTLLAVGQLNLLGNQSSLSLHLTSDDVFAETALIQAAGAIQLEGHLNVALAGGYRPQLGDVYQLLASEAGLAGDFFSEHLPELGAGLGWAVERTTNSLSLAVVEVAGLPGDFDSDGNIDGRDLLAWQRDRGVGDLADWQASYGSASLETAVRTVPEPLTVTILGPILFYWISVRTR
jgi:T5SS/PEP-CTERM-associated repeat protein